MEKKNKMSKYEKRIKAYKDEYTSKLEILKRYNLDDFDIFMYIKFIGESSRLSFLTWVLIALTFVLAVATIFDLSNVSFPFSFD